MKTIYALLPFVFCAVLAYTSPTNEVTQLAWSANTSRLQELARLPNSGIAEAASSLEKDLTRYYELLRDKEWRQTYELRAKAFRKDFPESRYLSEATRSGQHWKLVNYEIVSCDFQTSIGSTEITEAILICKFLELPGNAVSYSTVFWHKEDGNWKCLAPGPRKLDIFRPTRPVSIDWNS